MISSASHRRWQGIGNMDIITLFRHFAAGEISCVFMKKIVASPLHCLKIDDVLTGYVNAEVLPRYLMGICGGRVSSSVDRTGF